MRVGMRRFQYILMGIAILLAIVLVLGLVSDALAPMIHGMR
jgi:hypothetical protein